MKLKIENPFLTEVVDILRDIVVEEDNAATKSVIESLLDKLESVHDFNSLEVRMLETSALMMERWYIDDDRMAYSCRSVLVQTDFYRPAARKDNPSFYMKQQGYVPRLKIA